MVGCKRDLLVVCAVGNLLHILHDRSAAGSNNNPAFRVIGIKVNIERGEGLRTVVDEPQGLLFVASLTLASISV